MKIYHKLVRDKIPEIIQRDGKKPIISIADEKEYRLKLREKLQEEVDEFLDSENVEELADILEVVYALADVEKVTTAELEKIREKKEQERGGFRKRIILENV
ncbi:nucleoside triphosphate pyrophosphohydrolase [Candidatus Woesearchaeota archaeon]|nr:nucleoside triphosphate pyrophosphohydrolase [Candidatus Woesearchaeota archaeon]